MTQRTAGVAPSRAWRRWAVACVLWVAFIWGHSLVQGPESSSESGFFANLAMPLFNALGVYDLDLMTFIVRKGAHFTEYAVLGVLVRGLVASRTRGLGVKAMPQALLAALVPVADECIQLFVPGRAGKPTDVLIDLSGLVCGVALAKLCVYLKKSMFRPR